MTQTIHSSILGKIAAKLFAQCFAWTLLPSFSYFSDALSSLDLLTSLCTCVAQNEHWREYITYKGEYIECRRSEGTRLPHPQREFFPTLRGGVRGFGAEATAPLKAAVVEHGHEAPRALLAVEEERHVLPDHGGGFRGGKHADRGAGLAQRQPARLLGEARGRDVEELPEAAEEAPGVEALPARRAPPAIGQGVGREDRRPQVLVAQGNGVDVVFQRVEELVQSWRRPTCKRIRWDERTCDCPNGIVRPCRRRSRDAPISGGRDTLSRSHQSSSAALRL